MKELCGLCFIACSIFCAAPESKVEPIKPAKSSLYSAHNFRPRLKRNVRITGVPPIVAFVRIVEKPPLHPSRPLGSEPRPASVPAVATLAVAAQPRPTSPTPLPFLDITSGPYSPKENK